MKAQSLSDCNIQTENNEKMPVYTALYIPRYQTKDKHKNACEQTLLDLFKKYNLTEDDRWDYKRRYNSYYETLMKFNGNMNMFDDEWMGNGESERAFNLNKAYEKVMKWNIKKTLLYIIEARVRYRWGWRSRYSVKYDKHLYQFCYLFAQYYYEDDLEKKVTNLQKTLYDETGDNYHQLTNYINSVDEYQCLRAIQNDTSVTAIEDFRRKYSYIKCEF